MKILNHIPAFAAGAALASVVTWQIAADRRVEPEASAPRAPAPEPTPAAVSKPNARLATELARLTKENEEMRAELEDAQTRLVDSDAMLKHTEAKLDELRRPMTADMMSSSLRAEMKSGEAIVTGGYRLPDGKRLYAFATPVLEQADGAESVRIEGRYLALTDAAVASAGLEGLATNAANTLQHGEVWVADERKAVIEQLAAAEGTDVMSYPSVSVKPGFSALIEAGGIQLKITPERADDRDGLSVELRLEQPAVTPSQPASPEGP